MKGIRVGVLTVSDRLARGEGEDLSGDHIRSWCDRNGYPVRLQATVSDGTSSVVPILLKWADSQDVDLILTTGGTGLTMRDRTPEALRAVLERPAPGLAEALRRLGERSTPMAVLSRTEAGVRGRCLLVSLPGSPGGVVDGLRALAPLVPHAVGLLQDPNHPHPVPNPA